MKLILDTLEQELLIVLLDLHISFLLKVLPPEEPMNDQIYEFKKLRNKLKLLK